MGKDDVVNTVLYVTWYNSGVLGTSKDQPFESFLEKLGSSMLMDKDY